MPAASKSPPAEKPAAAPAPGTGLSLVQRALRKLGLVRDIDFALYLPIAALVIYSFNASRLVTVWGGFSTHWYGELLRNAQILDAELGLGARDLRTVATNIEVPTTDQDRRQRPHDDILSDVIIFLFGYLPSAEAEETAEAT